MKREELTAHISQRPNRHESSHVLQFPMQEPASPIGRYGLSRRYILGFGLDDGTVLDQVLVLCEHRLPNICNKLSGIYTNKV